MKKILGYLTTLLLVGGALAYAQGDLSVQVLRLLTRTNTWSSTATQTFQNNLVIAGDTPADTTNKLYEINNDLYYNAIQLTTGGGPAGSHTLLSTTHTDTLAGTVARGDVIVGNATPKWSRLPLGTSGKFLKSDGTDASWSLDGGALTNLPAANLTGTIAAISGVNLTNLNASNLASGTVPVARLAGVIVNASVANAAAIAYSKLNLAASVNLTSDMTGVLPFANGGTGLSTAVDDSIPVSSGSAWVAKVLPNCVSATTALAYTTATNTFSCQALTVGSGTVTNVAMTVPSILAVAGTPVTTTGTLALTLANETQNTVFAGSNGGGSIPPTFRALVNADFPLSGVAAATYASVTVNTRGIVTAASATASLTTQVSGILPFANGGTGLSAASDDTVMVSSGAAWVAKAVPNCTTGLTYTTATNTFSCAPVVTEKMWLDAGLCQNATTVMGWSTPVANPAVGACVTGANTQKAVYDFADGASTLSIQKELRLSASWTSTIDVDLIWYTTATAGDVVWQVATICVPDASTGDPAFNTASTVTDTAKGTTNQYNIASITALTVTGCSASSVLYLRVYRDPTNVSDTLAATARLVGVELTLRRSL